MIGFVGKIKYTYSVNNRKMIVKDKVKGKPTDMHIRLVSIYVIIDIYAYKF